MRLIPIGVSGSFPGPDSPASCYLLEHEEAGRTWRVLVDLGSGALGALQRYADPLAVDAVLLSHLHADHCLDLTGYYVIRKYHPDGPRPAIPVWGPDGTAGRMARAYDLPERPGMTTEFDFRAFPEHEFAVGPLSVRVRRVVHPVPAYALRIAAGGSVLVYSGDTGPCPGLVEIARAADVFLCEASFVSGPANPPDLHLTGTDAGRAATAAGVGRLMLTHVPPWHDPQVALAEARTSYDGPAELAVPGRSYEL